MEDQDEDKIGLCAIIKIAIDSDLKWEFVGIMMNGNILAWLDDRGTFTPERETFLLLFAAYKGEL